jgi:chromate transporter
MNVIDLIFGFFLANILGYGGGPASIPLMYEEIVNRNHWTTEHEFSNILALGNTLPGPIATKIAAYVGYDVAGIIGVLAALAATIIPSAIALIFLVKILQRYKQSIVVKGMTLLVQPVIAVLMLVLTWKMGQSSIDSIGIWQSLIIAAIALWAMEWRKIHPALVILCAFIYGGIVLPYI